MQVTTFLHDIKKEFHIITNNPNYSYSYNPCLKRFGIECNEILGKCCGRKVFIHLYVQTYLYIQPANPLSTLREHEKIVCI